MHIIKDKRNDILSLGSINVIDRHDKYLKKVELMPLKKFNPEIYEDLFATPKRK